MDRLCLERGGCWVKIKLDWQDPKAIEEAINIIKGFDTKALGEGLDIICDDALAEGVEEYGSGLTVNGYEPADVAFEVTKEKRGDMTVHKVRMTGKDAPFVEFGAGVTYNDKGSYPIARPSGVVEIGEYGKGHGKDQFGWYYSDGNGSHHTFGTEMQTPMFNIAESAKGYIEAHIDMAMKEIG